MKVRGEKQGCGPVGGVAAVGPCQGRAPRAVKFGDLQEPRRGQGTSAVFIARNRFAVLDKGSNQIVIKNLNNEITKKAPSPCATTDAIFYAGTGTLLCRSEDKVLEHPHRPALMQTFDCFHAVTGLQ